MNYIKNTIVGLALIAASIIALSSSAIASPGGSYQLVLRAIDPGTGTNSHFTGNFMSARGGLLCETNSSVYPAVGVGGTASAFTVSGDGRVTYANKAGAASCVQWPGTSAMFIWVDSTTGVVTTPTPAAYNSGSNSWFHPPHANPATQMQSDFYMNAYDYGGSYWRFLITMKTTASTWNTSGNLAVAGANTYVNYWFDVIWVAYDPS